MEKSLNCKKGKYLLQAQNLVKIYNGKPVVNGITMELAGNSVAGLLGPNGAGKTTSFYMIAGLIRPDDGKIFLGEREITAYPIHKRAREGITYLPQEASVFRKLTVTDNIRMVLEMRGLDHATVKERTAELLAEMNMTGRADQKGFSLSGGERRRVEVMRALATDPQFILLDEPFAGVDPLAISDIKSMIIGLRNKGIGVFLSDHNVREALTVCDLAYIVNEGKVIESGSPQHIASSEIAKKYYLGEDFKL